MKTAVFMLLFLPIISIAQKENSESPFIGTFSLGTRNTISFFNQDNNTGLGIGGQFRIQPGKRLNTEWYFDYISSKNGTLSYRNDYHIGWSVMLYGKNNFDFTRLFQPFFIAGHCFDYTKLIEQNNKSNKADRLSMATQAGLGTHINITPKLDCSVSGQYMIHFGKDIHATTDGSSVIIEREENSSSEGHLLFTVSFNYKFFRLWKKG